MFNPVLPRTIQHRHSCDLPSHPAQGYQTTPRLAARLSPYSGQSAPQCLLKFNSASRPGCERLISFLPWRRDSHDSGFLGKRVALDPGQAAGPSLSEDNTHTDVHRERRGNRIHISQTHFNWKSLLQFCYLNSFDSNFIWNYRGS